MSLPRVAVVGRPNVGKSSLCNALGRQRVSIVEPTAGVTRDRVATICEFEDTWFELVDTGGHGIVDRDDLSEHVERQIQYAITQAQLILFVVDGREGLTALDRATADLLRAHVDRVRLIANKVDEPHMDVQLGEFIRLGFGEPMAVSAQSALGLRELREFVRDRISECGGTRPDTALRVAIVGKRNAGKSTLVNSLAGEERVIVSEVPGTTRDSVDVRIEKDGRTVMIIDTAGVRKKSRIADDLEFYAYSRALDAVRRADVVLFMIDATVPLGQVDKRLADMVARELKPCVLVVNKWDLVGDRAGTDDFGDYLDRMLTGLSFAPVAFTTATTGRNAFAVLDLAQALHKQAQIRVGTGELNQALHEALASTPPPSRRGRKRAKILYATQISVQPPTIVVFLNDVSLVTAELERFLQNRLRERLPFDEIPIRLLFRARRERAVKR